MLATYPSRAFVVSSMRIISAEDRIPSKCPRRDTLGGWVIVGNAVGAAVFIVEDALFTSLAVTGELSEWLAPCQEDCDMTLVELENHGSTVACTYNPLMARVADTPAGLVVCVIGVASIGSGRAPLALVGWRSDSNACKSCDSDGGELHIDSFYKDGADGFCFAVGGCDDAVWEEDILMKRAKKTSTWEQ